MPFSRTELATDWAESTNWFGKLLASIVSANPSYEGKFHLVRSWVIEFDEGGLPCREIALDAKGSIVFAGPSKKDYGFWMDTDMKQADFAGEPVTPEQFEALWVASGVTCP